jgi:DNA-binding transcriptional MerR regulator
MSIAPTRSLEIQLFEPPANAVYTIDSAAHLAHVPRRTIAVYYKYGLVSSTVDPARNGYYFDKEAILTLRRIEDLRTVCRNDLAVVKMILDLTNEVERLNSKMRSLSQNSSTRKRSLKSNQRRKTK